MSKNKYYVYTDNKYWNHRSPLKCIVNPILRRLQFFTDRPYVIASKTEFIDGEPNFIKYDFIRVKYYKK